MKGKFDANVVWPLEKNVRNWIVDRSTARDFTVHDVKEEITNPVTKIHFLVRIANFVKIESIARNDLNKYEIQQYPYYT